MEFQTQNNRGKKFIPPGQYRFSENFQLAPNVYVVKKMGNFFYVFLCLTIFEIGFTHFY